MIITLSMKILFTSRQLLSLHRMRFTNIIKFKSNIARIPKLDQQREYIKNNMECNTFQSINWIEFKDNILSKPGRINNNNINAILLQQMITASKFEPALLFAEHLKENLNDLNLGTINALLRLYYVLGKDNKLNESDKKIILYFYNYLHEKYKVLEPTTYECLLQSVCVIDKWEIGLKLLEDIFYMSTPTFTSFSVLIATLFKNSESEKALKLIQRSIDNERPLQYIAYNEWVKYIFRKYKQKSTRLKKLEDINLHLMNNCVTIDNIIADMLKKVFESVDCDVKNMKINRFSGQCSSCKDTLVTLELTTDEFNLLQNNIKEKLIVGSDLFQKTSPIELKMFQNFIENSGPFDIVLDALNILYGSNMATIRQKIFFLNTVVDYFLYRNKNTLLLGRKHMMNWSEQGLKKVLYKTKYFFTEDISQDDPYLISAAILSGPTTDFVSKDILRNHKFRLGDVHLRQSFQRWQWSRQWMVFTSKNKLPYFKPPLTFTPNAQKKGNIWHIPYKEEGIEETNVHNEGIPDLNNWLCIQLPVISK